MAVTAHPEATKVAYDVLKKEERRLMRRLPHNGVGAGRTAIIRVWAVVDLFCITMRHNKQLVTLDGRETAPQNAGKHLFMDKDGQPMRFYDAAIGGRAVGVPGLLSMLQQLHEWYGKTPWTIV